MHWISVESMLQDFFCEHLTLDGHWTPYQSDPWNHAQRVRRPIVYDVNHDTNWRFHIGRPLLRTRILLRETLDMLFSLALLSGYHQKSTQIRIGGTLLL